MVFVDLKENHRETYKGYEIRVRDTRPGELVGDRYYTAIAKKDEIPIYKKQGVSFKQAVDLVKNEIDFALSMQD